MLILPGGSINILRALNRGNVDDKIQVLIASSEVRPLAQTGGLADVVGSLPQALSRQGAGAAVIMPAYQDILDNPDYKLENLQTPFTIWQGGEEVSGSILRCQLAPDVPVYLVRCDRFFGRQGLYGHDGIEHPDNPERFAFFCKAVLKALPHLENYPDILVANDWQTGLLMPLLTNSSLERPKGVFIIHNQGYLGLVPPAKWPVLDLPDSYNTIDGLEYYGQASLLKAGIVFSRAVVTVSPTYAKEIQTPEGGQGLDGVMRHHASKLHGILNGIDYTIWDPAIDPLVTANYSPKKMAGKAKCKRKLLAEFKFKSSYEKKPLIGMVGRLAAQKGLGLLEEASVDIFGLGLGMIILGSGDSFNEDIARNLARRFPEQCKAFIGYDNALSHRIISGCDLVLIPSMYEPCGLVQMYGLKYGSVPVVRSVGGLNDTVRDFAGSNPDGVLDTGFKFSQFQAKALFLAVRRAVQLYNQPQYFANMIQAGMAENFSWDNSARQYIELFRQVRAQ